MALGALTGQSSGRTVVTNATDLVEIRGDVDTVVAVATYVEDHGFTPFDAFHLVESDGDTIVSSDGASGGSLPVST